MDGATASTKPAQARMSSAADKLTVAAGTLRVSDAMVVVVARVVAYGLRHGTLAAPDIYITALGVGALLTLNIFHLARLYLPERARRPSATLDRDAAAESLDKLMVARRERDIAYRTREQQRSRLENTVLRAPVEGIVQKLAIAAAGQSVRGGDPIMNVVPVGDSLIVEAQVGNQDIGYIRVGQTATVRVLTYDHIKHGTLEGVVEQISADAVEDQKTREFTFPVVVRTAKTYLGDTPGQFPVAPGMSAEVDFKLGRRSVLSYLTDRMEATTSSAFRER